MELELILSLSDPRASLETAGGKGASLARLSVAGLPVPAGFYVTTTAYRQFVAESNLQSGIFQDLELVDLAVPSTLEETSRRIQARFLSAPIPESIARAVRQAYASLCASDRDDSATAVAVRSSATAEDLPEASFAGQQETYLNIRGAESVLGATRKCWASLWTARAISYRVRQGIAPDQVALAVVVQALVAADAAGILFTADPVTGQRDRMVINAAWGLGEAVVGGLVTPDTYTVEKATGQVTNRAIADKQVMTVRTAGGTVEEAVPEAKRSAPSLSDAQLLDLARLGSQIEALYGMPMDIEWAVQESKVFILQARPITALPEPTQEVRWTMPDPKGKYLRGSIADFMPDPLTPLFESMILPLVGSGIKEVMKIHVGKTMNVYDKYLISINHFAYFSAHYTFGEWLQLAALMVQKMPLMIRKSFSWWIDIALPRYQAVTARWQACDVNTLSTRELWTGVRELFTEATRHLTMLQVSTLGIAAGSEGLFTAVYDKLIRRPGDPSAAIFMMGFESIPIRAEIALYELAQWAAGREGLSALLRGTSTQVIIDAVQSEAVPEGVSPADWAAFRERFQAHLNQYGYSIYNLDFAHPLPMDEPAPLVETIKLFLSGQGRSPRERQQSSAARREAAEQAVLARIKGPKRWLFNKLCPWAQKYGPAREDSIALMGLAYPVIRRLLAALGERMVRAGTLDSAGDIYWLTEAEIEALVMNGEQGAAGNDLKGAIAQRRAEWQTLKRVTPPNTLPAKVKVLGISADAFMPNQSNTAGASIRGVGASTGQVTAPARVLLGPDDFDQMRLGDILVAPFTTPAWTPLFVMASAIVTDVGGPLSHGSIVAREYGIPAVLGTGVATKRIHSGQVITVDGTKGVVTIGD